MFMNFLNLCLLQVRCPKVYYNIKFLFYAVHVCIHMCVLVYVPMSLLLYVSSCMFKYVPVIVQDQLPWGSWDTLGVGMLYFMRFSEGVGVSLI